MFNVSVPFRGLCSEMEQHDRELRFPHRRVSVPFRGLCSEIRILQSRIYHWANMFPSPFGVCVLKSNGDVWVCNNCLEVSVPFRGLCSEIVRTYAHGRG